MLSEQQMKINNEDFTIFYSGKLFECIAADEAQRLCECLGVIKKSYPKNSFIFAEGDEPDIFGFVLTGAVKVIQEDFWGNQSILARVGVGGMFGEAFSLLNKELPLNVIAAEKTTVLFINTAKVNNQCGQHCLAHSTLIINLMRILAGKNISLIQKIGFITRKTLREKIMMFLSLQAQSSKETEFTIPFNRQELADYLNADRSALSAELSRLSGEGVIVYRKNKFKLIK